VDQFIPSVGYVPSGTQQSASRTYAASGTKTIKVLAQDVRGLTSGWVSLAVTCADPHNQNQNQGNENNGQSDLQNTLPALTLRASPSLVRSGQSTTLS